MKDPNDVKIFIIEQKDINVLCLSVKSEIGFFKNLYKEMW